MKNLILLNLFILQFTISYSQPEYNPHHGLEQRFITSWNHSSSTRYDIPQRYLSTINAIQWAGVTVKNLDRPISSHVLPIITDVRATDPNLRFKILEDYIYQFRPVSPVNPLDMRRYGIAKSFNTRDVTQWELHHPALYVNEVNTNGAYMTTTAFKEEAKKYYIKDIDSQGIPILFTTNETDKAILYSSSTTNNNRYTKSISEAVNFTPIDNKLEYGIPKDKNETYTVLLNFDGRNKVSFLPKYSQINTIEFGRLEFDGKEQPTFFKTINGKRVNTFSIRKMSSDPSKDYLDFYSGIRVTNSSFAQRISMQSLGLRFQ